MAAELHFGVARELELVEKRLRECCTVVDVDTLSEIASYVVTSGGKRLRPIITLLSFRAVEGKDLDKAVDMAAAIELIHTGSLIHDDINDGGEMRRGKASAVRKYGLMDSLVTGDYLFSKSFELSGMFDEEVVQITADACSSLPAGEVLQRKYRFNTSLTVEEYVDMTERKTARLISAAAKTGALIGGGSREQVQNLGEYGRNIGIAFQIKDDILDVAGEEDVVGKRLGADIREGNITLLSIFAMNDGNETTRDELQTILGKKEKTGADVARSLEIIRDSGALEKAYEEAEEYVRKAKEKVSSFQNEYRDRLMELADYSVSRGS